MARLFVSGRLKSSLSFLVVKSILLYKKKCPYCRTPFPTTARTRITCGDSACKERHASNNRPAWRVQPSRAMLTELEKRAKVKDKSLPPSYSLSYFKAYREKNRLKLTKKDKKRYITNLMYKELLKKTGV